uniref:Uncharacterized protein n=1 Tax=Anguilla anguilla TaxID=7936 RepID=A0A0E9U5R1_ANGAN
MNYMMKSTASLQYKIHTLHSATFGTNSLLTS